MRFCSLLVLALAVVGCDSTPAITPPAAPPPVLPLAVGTEWTVMRTTAIRYEPDGSVRDTLLTAPDKFYTLTVSRDTVVAGETWFRIENSSISFIHCVFGGVSWFANREDGLYRWRTDPKEAERVYATGVPEGEPFLVTPVVTAVLADDDAMIQFGSETVEVRQYDRTWKRFDLRPGLQGPIDPNVVSRDQLSTTRGPVTLEIAYVRQIAEGQFGPNSRVQYELTDGPQPSSSARAATAPPGTYAVR